MTRNDAENRMLVERCALPEAAGMDALEACLVVVQEVPHKMELQFFAARGNERARLSTRAALALLREHVPQKPLDRLSAAELLVEVAVLRAEVDRMRPVYAMAKTWRDGWSRDSLERRAIDAMDARLRDAVDVAAAAEEP